MGQGRGAVTAGRGQSGKAFTLMSYQLQRREKPASSREQDVGAYSGEVGHPIRSHIMNAGRFYYPFQVEV